MVAAVNCLFIILWLLQSCAGRELMRLRVEYTARLIAVAAAASSKIRENVQVWLKVTLRVEPWTYSFSLIYSEMKGRSYIS